MHPFSRTERLIGPQGLKTLAASRVLVFGVGGVGSHCIEALARTGVGTLALVDNDKVALSNINRQSIALHSTLGRQKTHVMAEKIKDINPQATVMVYDCFVLEDNILPILEECRPDYVVDAIDTVTAKLALAQLCTNLQIPLISCMGTGNKLDPFRFEIADIYQTSVCPLCKVMRRELKKRGVPRLKVLYSKEPPIAPAQTAQEEESAKRAVPGSIAFVPPVAGLLIAAEVVRDLLKAEPLN